MAHKHCWMTVGQLSRVSNGKASKVDACMSRGRSEERLAADVIEVSERVSVDIVDNEREVGDGVLNSLMGS